MFLPLRLLRSRAGSLRIASCSRPAIMVAAVFAWQPSNAFGQAITPVASPPTKAPQDPHGNSIVVTGSRPYIQNLIDRKIYSVSKDLQSGSGSAADVLRNIPSVDVDAQGAVSIRGDSNVQILIDGKPSTTMSARTRADALEQLPASSIDHVEVITTPGAQYKPDASGGVINIITKQDRASGTSGTVNASAGTDQSINLNGTATRRAGRWTYSGSIALKRDVRWRPFTDNRIQTDSAGGQSRVEQSGLFSGPRIARTVSATTDFDPTSRDRLSAHGSYTYRTGVPHLSQKNIIQNAVGLTTTQYVREATGHEQEVDSEISGSYRHQFAGKDHQFTLTLRRGESVENESRLFHSFYILPAGLQEIDQQFPRADELQQELTLEYARPLAGGKLLAGYDREQDDDDFRNRGIFIDPETLITSIDPSRTNRFHYRQIVNAWYLSFDRTLREKFSLSAGLRLESTSVGTNQIDLALRHHSTYFKAYPSMHLEYELADRQKVRVGYSRRIVRPDPEDLDPYPVFSDPLNERTGNANLKPEEIEAIETEYERDSKHGSFDFTGFLRRTTNEFTLVSRLISPTDTVILTTHENLGSSTAVGIDASAQGTLLTDVTYRLSGSIYRDEVNASNLGYIRKRAAIVEDVKAGIDVDLGKSDLLQLDGNYRGRRLTAQGYRLSSLEIDLGLRHTFPNHMVGTLAVSDLFDSRRDRVRLTTSELREFTVRRNGGRRLSVALTLPLGRAEKGNTN